MNKELTTSTKDEDKIFKMTRSALQNKIVTKEIRVLSRGNDEQVWKISGSDGISFIFNGKEIRKLTIAVEVKAIPTKKTISQEFTDKKFVKKMHDLFVNKENLMKLQEKQKINFISEFKSNLK
jgi:hypothetical protein